MDPSYDYPLVLGGFDLVSLISVEKIMEPVFEAHVLNDSSYFLKQQTATENQYQIMCSALIEN